MEEEEKEQIIVKRYDEPQEDYIKEDQSENMHFSFKVVEDDAEAQKVALDES